MAFLGNLNGPRESEIVDRLGHEYFGISPLELTLDVEHFEHAEGRNEVQPVHVDELGRPYIMFSRRGHGSERCCPEDHGYALPGEVLTYTREEALRWSDRQLYSV